MILKEKIYPIIEFTAPLSKDQTEAPPLELMWVFKKNFWMEKCQKSSTAISPWLFTDDAEKLQRVKRNIGNETEGVHFNLMRIWEFDDTESQRLHSLCHLMSLWCLLALDYTRGSRVPFVWRKTNSFERRRKKTLENNLENWYWMKAKYRKHDHSIWERWEYKTLISKTRFPSSYFLIMNASILKKIYPKTPDLITYVIVKLWIY